MDRYLETQAGAKPYRHYRSCYKPPKLVRSIFFIPFKRVIHDTLQRSAERQPAVAAGKTHLASVEFPEPFVINDFTSRVLSIKNKKFLLIFSLNRISPLCSWGGAIRVHQVGLLSSCILALFHGTVTCQGKYFTVLFLCAPHAFLATGSSAPNQNLCCHLSVGSCFPL